MLGEIIVTSPNKEVTQLVEKIRNELNVYVTVIETSFEAAVSLVKGVLYQNPERIKVIASGGATMELLRQALPSAHMVSIHPTEYDIVLALDQARMFGKEIGLFLAGSEDPQVIEKLSAVLDLKTKIFVYNNWKELEFQVVKARRAGIEVVLGVGERISTFVRQEGLQYVSVSAGENTIRNALARAKDIVTLLEITKTQEETKSRRELFTKGLVAKYCFDDIIHANSKMSSIISKARKYANTDCTVLIRGESGTGKELLAQSVHNEHSVRSKGPFIAVNCASLDDNLLKSELFGYTEGSFTGASKGGKPGLFELANGGTLFLDEIGKMKLEPQGNLLRVLQEKEVRRIGSERVIPVDVRVIAASNEDLEDLVRKGSFREDLYFRLNVLKIALPPLRERAEDISDQVVFFLRKFSFKYNKAIYTLPPLVFQKFSNMNWPGNSRQLENLVERCVVLADNEEDLSDIVMELLEEEFGDTVFSTERGDNLAKDQISVRISTLAEMNIEIVRRMRARAKLSNSELALRLGISRPTLTKMLNFN
ncbi:MAG: sigma 54-interacting transcriptional regulator [Bacillota bacterium]|nr:sigma 54-interacting transcriptional regulator [Bacillota bacterium]